MGTSNAYGGPGGGTPLVPTWLGSDGPALAPPVPPPPANAPAPDGAPAPVPTPPALPPIPDAAAADRFTMARNNLSRFATSGGADRASLGRAVSQYVSTAAGGSRTAAQRMGASRVAGANLLNFLSNATVNGPREALRALNLQSLAGRPIEEVFLGLMDYVCQGQDGGTVDEGIAREAFIETITELAENGITDIDALTADQMQTIFNSVHDAEKGRTHPDTEGKYKHSNDKESWMSNDYSGGLRTFPRKFRDGIFHSASH